MFEVLVESSRLSDKYAQGVGQSMDRLTNIELAVAATRHSTANKINSRMRLQGATALEEHLDQLDTVARSNVRADAEDLQSHGVIALLRGTKEYPKFLDLVPNAPPVLFCSGQTSLLTAPSVGICGARNVSREGLQAAVNCGRTAADHDLVTVSGYARGVDMATHISTLASGGSTIVVLPEGISHFRVKQEIGRVWDPDRSLVVSQFSPNQPWSAGAAMTRNTVIIGLSLALLVIEAGDKGGTLAAGQRALELGRRVIALEFLKMPPGNSILLEEGAEAVRDLVELSSFLDELRHVVDEPDTSSYSDQHTLTYGN